MLEDQACVLKLSFGLKLENTFCFINLKTFSPRAISVTATLSENMFCCTGFILADKLNVLCERDHEKTDFPGKNEFSSVVSSNILAFFFY